MKQDIKPAPSPCSVHHETPTAFPVVSQQEEIFSQAGSLAGYPGSRLLETEVAAINRQLRYHPDISSQRHLKNIGDLFI